MTTAKRIVLLPGGSLGQRVSSSEDRQITAREAWRCDDFLRVLAEEARIPGMIHEGDYQPSDDDVLLCWPDALASVLGAARNPAAVGARSLLIGVMRSRAAQEAETRRVAGVIDAAAYSQWQIDYPKAEAALYGLRSLKESFPHQISGNPRDASEAYVRYVGAAGVALPTFAAWYIRALMG